MRLYLAVSVLVKRPSNQAEDVSSGKDGRKAEGAQSKTL